MSEPTFTPDCYVIEHRGFYGCDYYPAKITKEGKNTLTVEFSNGRVMKFNGTRADGISRLDWGLRQRGVEYNGATLSFDLEKCARDYVESLRIRNARSRSRKAVEIIESRTRNREASLTEEQLQALEFAAKALETKETNDHTKH